MTNNQQNLEIMKAKEINDGLESWRYKCKKYLEIKSITLFLNCINNLPQLCYSSSLTEMKRDTFQNKTLHENEKPDLQCRTNLSVYLVKILLLHIEI